MKCHYCGASAPLVKMQGYETYICAAGHGCQAEFRASVRQIATVVLMVAAIAAVTALALVVPYLLIIEALR